MIKSLVDKVLRKPTADAKVIFNPSSGDAAQSDEQLEQIRTTLHDLGLKTDVTRVRPHSHIHRVAARAAKRGTPFVVACGGDNTIDLAARGIVGTETALVIVPTGTRNNIALALNLPEDVASAAQLVKTGQRSQVDVGRAQIVGRHVIFLELITIGLSAAMFPGMDEAQKGNLGKIGDLLSTFISHPAVNFDLCLEQGREKISVQALTLVVMNMPYLGANSQIASDVDYRDGLLDVFLYGDLGKLELLSHLIQITQGATDDPRVRHLRVKQIEIKTDAPLPVMLDGNVLSDKVLRGRTLRLECLPRRLNVMIPA